MNVGETIELPAVAIRPVQVGCARLHHVVRAARDEVIAEVGDCPVSARRRAVLARTASGESLVLTTWSDCPPIADTDAVLLVGADGRPIRWLHHRALASVEAELRQGGFRDLREHVATSWIGSLSFAQERTIGGIAQAGLRPPQLAALHAIAAHLLLETQCGTVVMPTGTGKTETMLAAMVGSLPGPLVVALPGRALTDQTIAKFLTLGLLRRLLVVSSAARNPVVAVIDRRAKDAADYSFLSMCNVVIGTVSALAQGTASATVSELVSQAGSLVLDEAHHVAAATWTVLREAFANKPVLQFTATPFRRDGQEVDGRIILNYPLSRAQRDGYFKPIHFEGVSAGSVEESDRKICAKALQILSRDLAAGRDHLLMARCASIARAEQVLALYVSAAPEHEPLLIHSEQGEAAVRAAIDRFRDRRSRVAVCVDMLGEGFDLPQLKIAGMHDAHKSIAILLQFTGRFTRTNADNIGDASVIANVDDPSVPDALERLYSEDPDWNRLLADYSFEAISEQQDLLEFLRQAVPLQEPSPGDAARLALRLLRPLRSTVVYRASTFHPANFHYSVSDGVAVPCSWEVRERRVLVFVTLTRGTPRWSRSRSVADATWDLYVVHFDPDTQLLFIHSTNRETLHLDLAKAISGDDVSLIQGELMFRCLGGIRRLRLQNVGLKTRGPKRHVRYSMFSGADVAAALSPQQQAGTTRSNLYGSGYDAGVEVGIGCSAKGRVWSREYDTLPGFVAWCRAVGRKLLDDSIDADKVLDNVLIPAEVKTLPEGQVLAIDWPAELQFRAEDQVDFVLAGEAVPLSRWGLRLIEYVAGRPSFSFAIETVGTTATFELRLDEQRAFFVVQTGGPEIQVHTGGRQVPCHEYLSEAAPVLYFVDGSELDGHILARPKEWNPPPIGEAQVEGWNWSGTDIQVESAWKDGTHRPDSVQARATQEYLSLGFDFVFDDDAPGEAADLVCMRELPESIDLRLVHCKFSGAPTAGQRVDDVVEVASQAIRAVRWMNRFKALCLHLRGRADLLPNGRGTRYLHGDSATLNRMLRLSKVKPVKLTVVAVQPGVRKGRASDSQLTVLAAANGFLLETVGVGLHLVCSQ